MNEIIGDNDQLVLKPNSVINLSVYDFDSLLVDDAHVSIVDSGHTPFRFFDVGTIYNDLFSIYVTDGFDYEIIVSKLSENGDSLLMNFGEVDPGSSLTITPKEEELAHLDFTILNKDGTFDGLCNLIVRYPRISLEQNLNFFSDSGNIDLWITPELTYLEVLDHTSSWTFSFYSKGDEYSLEAGQDYRLEFGGPLNPIFWIFPETNDYWIQVYDSQNHTLNYCFRPDDQPLGTLKIVDPSNDTTVFQEDFNNFFEGKIPFDPLGHKFEISLDLNQYGSFNLSGNISSANFLELETITTTNFRVEYPSFLGDKTVFLTEFVEKSYNMTAEQMGFFPVSLEPDGKIRVIFIPNGGWASGSTIGIGVNQLVDRRGLAYPEYWGRFQGMFLHELSHVSRGTALSHYWPGWFNEAHATMVSICVFEKIWGEDYGFYVRGTGSQDFFKHLKGEDVDIFWRMLFVFLYLEENYGTDINRNFTQIWANDTINDEKKELIDDGFGENETIVILYSMLAGENLEWLFSLAGINVEPQMIIDGLEKIYRNDYSIFCDNREFNVSIETNCFVLSLEFLEKEGIIFETAGLANRTQHCKVTIPKELLDEEFSIYLDETPLTYEQYQNSTHNSLFFTYGPADPQIRIVATYAIPESSTTSYFVFFFVSTIFVFSVVINRKESP